MREKNRKPIASCLKLPQFTTMNVIDGQAGLIIYASLIFYSLTIDNILNIIVLLILAGVTIATLTGENGILNQATKAKEKTEEASKAEEENLNEMVYIMSGEDTSGANYPVMKDGMKKVYWKEDGTEVKEGEEGFEISKWYNYKAQNGRTDIYNEKTQEWGSSHWANATLDGNYYVWIPRYCYKIYDNSEEEGYEEYTTQEEGKSYRIDVKFLSGISNEVESGYIVHPAFKFGDEELEGIWVGKYETTGDQNIPTILPNQESVKNMDVATMFSTAQKLSKTNIDAHMMKNIEWGAVAYLAQSQYGRNGTEVSVNQCSNYITGAGRGIGDNAIYNSTYTIEESTKLPQQDQQYNGKIGKLSSTTGNIYGIYDMSGGTNEYVMGFYTPDGKNLGYSGFSTFTPDSKYYDLYQNTSDNHGDYSSSKNGDATKETVGWNGDFGTFVISSRPVFARGGIKTDLNPSGIFYFIDAIGNVNMGIGFRVCLAI